MPILPIEPVKFPADLFACERQGTGDDADRLWWCLHTKPRQEKSLARALHARGVAYYLPQLLQESRTPGGRRIQSMAPLFPGYLFLYGNHHERAEAIQGNHLANFLRIEDQAGIDQDLHRLDALMSSGFAIAPVQTFVVGDTVRILNGPLRGLVGTVSRRNGRDRFVAIVQFLGRGAAVDLQDSQVEPVAENSGGDFDDARSSISVDDANADDPEIVTFRYVEHR